MLETKSEIQPAFSGVPQMERIHAVSHSVTVLNGPCICSAIKTQLLVNYEKPSNYITSLMLGFEVLVCCIWLFWRVMIYNWVSKSQHFGASQYFHLHGQAVQKHQPCGKMCGIIQGIS